MVSLVMSYDKVGIQEAQVQQVAKRTVDAILSVAKLVSNNEVST